MQDSVAAVVGDKKQGRIVRYNNGFTSFYMRHSTMSATDVPVAFSTNEHDHAACVVEAMERARQICSQRGLRLTAIRHRVLELVWHSHKPIKAYDLLSAIRAEQQNAAPTTVYRALDFLQKAGLVHRIESLNAFVGCDAAHGDNAPKFLICRHCGRAAEVAGVHMEGAIAREAKVAGFDVEEEVVEIIGTCSRCTNA